MMKVINYITKVTGPKSEFVSVHFNCSFNFLDASSGTWHSSTLLSLQERLSMILSSTSELKKYNFENLSLRVYSGIFVVSSGEQLTAYRRTVVPSTSE